MLPVITLKEADKVLRSKEGEISLSLDLGISKTLVQKTTTHLIISAAGKTLEPVPLTAFKKVKEKTCYVIEDGLVKPIEFFSEETDLYYKLVPTADWPTITLSSTPMHVLTSPKRRTFDVVKEIEPITGTVLDTCCGLGYTAIASAQHATVHVFERDPTVLEVCKLNPHSQELFSHKNIVLHQQDVNEGIKKLKDNTFDRIVHDPPTPTYSPLLYATEFHEALFRVLKPKGILYHYIAWPKKTSGVPYHPRVIKSLERVGFKNVEYHEKTSGIRAIKP